MFELFPAIDIVDGQAVRLRQGESGSETAYGKPLEIAQSFFDQGAKWLHIVDLDAAFGRGNNADVIAEIVTKVPVKAEVSGGLRDEEALQRVFSLGVQRVNLGTAALEKPEWTAQMIEKYAEKIAVGLDVRGEKLVRRGWVAEGGDLFEQIAQLDQAGCQRYVVTDVERDGMLCGPHVELLQRVAQASAAKVVASGGVSSLTDLLALRDAGCLEGAIVGKALYAGQFTLDEAFAALAG